MATKKAAAAQRRQEYKYMVLSYLRKNEGPQRRDLVLRDLRDQENLCKDKRNSLDQVIETMTEKGIIFKFDAEHRECLGVDDAAKTITKEKRKKPRLKRGKAKCHRRSQERGPRPSPSMLSGHSSLPYFDLESGEDSDTD